MTWTRICAIATCGTEFTTNQPHKKYCSRKCQTKGYHAWYRKEYLTPKKKVYIVFSRTQAGNKVLVCVYGTKEAADECRDRLTKIIPDWGTRQYIVDEEEVLL